MSEKECMRRLKILYFSTHEPLEYDDIKLFQSMGHSVFSTGKFNPAEAQKTHFRPPIKYGDDVQELVEAYHHHGCSTPFTDLGNTILTEDFLNLFDLVICIQDVSFIAKFWHMMKQPTVVWRTVGQAIEHFDAIIAPFRDKGMKIVRWSEREKFANTYIGHDAIIRAYKNPDEYGPWEGNIGKIVTFSSHFAQRYPIELGWMQRTCRLLDYGIGGPGNEDVPNALGMLSLSDMQNTLKSAAAYYYCHGSVVPYTLNFIEAWMTGIPVVAASRNVEIINIDMRFNEVNDFIVNMQNGILYSSEREARSLLMELLVDKSFARSVGNHGRQTAIRLFGKERAMADWDSFFRAHCSA